MVAFTPSVVALVVAVAVLAGAVNGVAGFGFALVGTMALATTVDPAVAVVFMILPILSVNLSLVGDLSVGQLRTCGRRFAPLMGAGLAGTVAGLVALDVVPAGPLRVGLGVLSLAFVANAQEAVRLLGLERAKEGCFVESPAAMAAVGGVSGLLFGGTNVGVQLIAYLRSCELSHGSSAPSRWCSSGSTASGCSPRAPWGCTRTRRWSRPRRRRPFRRPPGSRPASGSATASPNDGAGLPSSCC